MSKLAAFHARDARAVRAANAGPTPRAIIPQFLEDNGYVPHRLDPQGQLSGSIAPDTMRPGNQEFTPHFTSDFCTTRTSPNGCDAKPPVSHALFANMTPEPMESIEAGPSNETVAMLNNVAGVNRVEDSVLATHNNNKNFGSNNPQQHDVNMLHGRLSHLENVVQAMQNVLVPDVKNRLTTVETALEGLKSKVGEGCEAEVAKMREVFGGMRETMARVGNFL